MCIRDRPATGHPEMIRKLIAAGTDVFRLNFSHGDYSFHARCIQTVRREAEAAGRPVAVLQDLQGPRIRTGILSGHQPVELTPGEEIILCYGTDTGSHERIFVNYMNLAEDLHPGDKVLIADGALELHVIETAGSDIRCRIIVGGLLGEHKGINLPDTKLSISSPTEKDIEDLHFGIANSVDYVALSFVEKADDIDRLKKEIRQCCENKRCMPVIAKIERPVAVQNLDQILEVSDGVMVARGDLGIEMPPETVPRIQKRIIHEANVRAVPVITATQMLESMINAPRPTRAEASDVANAILDGTDAVMLSAETSVGSYPVEAVAIMDSIAREIESLRRHQPTAPPPDIIKTESPRQAALASAACSIARRLDADAVAAFTITGSTARYLSQRRPEVPVCALTPDPQTYRLLSLLWGVQAVMLDVFESTDDMFSKGSARLLELGLVSHGSTVIYVAGGTAHTPGGTDMLKIETVA